MAPVAHILISWMSAVPIFKNRRERTIAALAGVSPDIDGFGVIIDVLTDRQTNYYSQYHHLIGHNLLFACFISIIAMIFAKSQKLAVLLLSFLLIHIHILCDIIGSRGPDGHQWPILYLAPFNKTFEITWTGQWELTAWQNQVIFIFMLLISLYVISKKEITFFEVFSQNLDKEILKIWHKYILKKE